MKKTENRPKGSRIGDEAVRAKTGKTWPQWFAELDGAGARKLNHKQIVALIGAHHPELGGWWRQMVTVGYEEGRGLRDKHQKPSGYQISGSKTVRVSLAKLYKAWQQEKIRDRWLQEPGVLVRSASAQKSMRITWPDGSTTVVVNFYDKGEGKSQVTIEHGKLPNSASGERMKAYWREALERLKGYLEG